MKQCINIIDLYKTVFNIMDFMKQCSEAKKSCWDLRIDTGVRLGLRLYYCIYTVTTLI